MKFFKNLFKGRDQIKRELLEEIRAEQEEKRKEEERIRKEEAKKAEEEARIKEEARKEAENKLKESDEPWVDVKAIGQEKDNIKIELDWNDAFVKYLKDNGFTGSNDEEIVHRYIAIMYRQLIDETNTTDGDYV